MNPWLSQVNQKLFFAQLLIDLKSEQEDRYGHIELVLCQSVVFQLECAYRHHLREVAATYKFGSPDQIETVEQLAEGLKSAGKHPAEAQEMLYLEQDDQSWLQHMLAAWESFHRLPQQPAEADTASPIPVMQVSAASQQTLAELNVALVQSWLAAMKELVDRHRELMVEC